MRAQICFEEALKLSKKEFEGAKSRRREKKESKKLSRELQEAPEEAPSHDPSTLSTFYSAKRAGVRVLGHRPSLPLELSALFGDFQSSRSSFGGPIALFFDFCLIILVCGASAGLFSKKLVLVCRSWLQIFRTAIIAPNARFPESFILAPNVVFP